MGKLISARLSSKNDIISCVVASGMENQGCNSDQIRDALALVGGSVDEGIGEIDKLLLREDEDPARRFKKC